MQFLFPVVSQLRPEEAIEKVSALKNRLFELLMIFGLVSGTVLYVYAEHIAVFFFGETFRASGDILRYSALFVAFNFLLQANFSIMAGLGKIRSRASILLGGLVLNLVLSLSLIEAL
ncbi:MAG TPA: hypothetical protein PK765_04265 [bacterium]|nr:hypothetical protein [bacterium]